MRWTHCRSCGIKFNAYTPDTLDGLCSQNSADPCFVVATRWAIWQLLIPRNGSYTEEKYALDPKWQVAIDMWLTDGKPRAPDAQTPGTVLSLTET